MQDIRQVIRRKQAQQAQLSKEIELLQQVEEKLREVAPLLADSEEDENAVLGEVDEEIGQSRNLAAKAASASAGSEAAVAQSEPAMPARPLALRWP
jgi:DNA-binding protein H-NS